MMVERAKTKVKCDASGWQNICTYTIVNKRFVFDGSVYLCEECMKEINGEKGRFFIPKNVKPIYKKGGKDE